MVLAVAQFSSLKAKKLLRVLQAEPLGYRIVRQKGSHRKMEAPNRPTVVFAFHDNQTIRPSTVKDILCSQVGLAEQDALALLWERHSLSRPSAVGARVRSATEVSPPRCRRTVPPGGYRRSAASRIASATRRRASRPTGSNSASSRLSR